MSRSRAPRRLTRWQLLDVERAARDARAAGDHAVSVHGVTRFFGPPGGAQPPQQKEEPCSSSSAAGADAAPAAAVSKRKQRSAARLAEYLRRRELLAAAVLQLKLCLSVVKVQRAWRRFVAGRAVAAQQLAGAEMDASADVATPVAAKRKPTVAAEAHRKVRRGDEVSGSPSSSSMCVALFVSRGLASTSTRTGEESDEPPPGGRRAPGARDATRGASAEPAPLLLSSAPPPGSARGCVGELDGGAVRPQRRPD